MLDFTSRLFGPFGTEAKHSLGRDRDHAVLPSLGMTAGTRVATSIGWRPVEAVIPGDRVLTFDCGLREVVSVERCTVFEPCPKKLWPLRVPAGVLGNTEAMIVLAEQPVLLEADCAEDLFGDPFVLVPAMALEGHRGIERVAPGEIDSVIALHFAADQVVFVNSGGLFFCPMDKSRGLESLLSDECSQTYVTLPMDLSRDLVKLIDREAMAMGATA
ncbi:Hint domain-containing protein [Oceaniglobus indicus]|uniref:Hint domain-containing protein n=1 Tax=Oceaniglobus indicus TaxID=2047749 RepID=UPI000C19A140|nr:Hint domain-containing protein [Oceaniglobus indicus]